MTREPRKAGPEGGRPTCYTCWRPESHCVCRLVAPFEAHCSFLILQHPNERRKYYSTVRLLKSALTNLKVLQGVTFEGDGISAAIGGKQAYILFPSPDAADCSEVKLSADDTVIVIDGTWSEAGKILRRNPILDGIPRLSFRNEIRSEYQIRKQPKEHCLSTLECIAHLLTQNANHFGLSPEGLPYERLLEGFRTMVGKQLQYFPRMQQSGGRHVG